jgi:hypothetical protein
MLRKLATILTIAVVVVFVLSTVVLAAEFEGTVSAVDDKGMATIKATDGKEHKVSITGSLEVSMRRHGVVVRFACASCATMVSTAS